MAVKPAVKRIKQVAHLSGRSHRYVAKVIEQIFDNSPAHIPYEVWMADIIRQANSEDPMTVSAFYKSTAYQACAKYKFQLRLQREDSEQNHHVMVEAYTTEESTEVFRRDYPDLKEYFIVGREILEA